MTEEKILEYAAGEGFAAAAMVKTAEIPFDASFREYCAENLCGQYGANWSCPPECGSPAYMREKVLSRPKALVLQTIWEISDYTDKKAIRHAKDSHNAATLRLYQQLKKENISGFMVGASGCGFCDKCAILEGKPCKMPEYQMSCMSAYCIFVRKLCERCGLEYDCGPGLLAFFGMIVFEDNA